MAQLPPIRISAPGKVILHGEHSVVYGKLAVAASLGLRTRLEFFNLEEKDGVTIEFPALHFLHSYKLEDVQDLLDKNLPLTTAPSAYNFTHPEFIDHEKLLNVIKTFIDEKTTVSLESKQKQALISFFYLFSSFFSTFDSKLTPFNLKIQSDLTIGAGTGSSASFAVTLVAFLLQYIRSNRPRSKNSYKPYSVTNTNLGVFDAEELELISKWAFQSEKIMHGTPSGVDNTICTHGGLVEFRKGTPPKLVRLATKFNLILISTHVSRDTKRLVSLVAEKREKYKSLIDGVLETMDHVSVEAVNVMKKITGGRGDVSESYESLGELTDMNQNLLRCLGVSHPKLEEICYVLGRKGLHGKLTGAGGGGYAICLVPPDFNKETVQDVVEELKRKGFGVVLTDLGGCGVTIDSV